MIKATGKLNLQLRLPSINVFSISWHITVVRMRLGMVNVVFSFIFSFINFLSLRSPSTVSNSYLMLLLSVIITLFPDLLTQSSHGILVLPCPFPPFSVNLIPLPVFYLSFFPHDRSISTYSSPIFS